jgi:hypothetical protein
MLLNFSCHNDILTCVLSLQEDYANTAFEDAWAVTEGATPFITSSIPEPEPEMVNWEGLQLPAPGSEPEMNWETLTMPEVLWMAQERVEFILGTGPTPSVQGSE